ncbi:MAG: C4-dicarboxylate ABC transporter substrate-binding protein [Treponema sp. GWB1_62_6]|nr:MAG: C4-dicarboxylate ABC transporter substrate-binding protein [Treponema sp. GWA1_62_8]OHE67617.1 MAG: C4-dicarboxylate ABC transporter substrate-binding protein [Treponema sp. GWC1_61_84]OHE70010.1 MAG: C4-dicarboxylate ABC transporter substrate-binding protein [Treponema sp. GWB1_62_6]OHE70530.1 MAG: C4-dicarboxylate ABC transporter substrate-binding protein [Treponema sp. RIFOXYC1_FULL_61_9]HCM25834.1 C4-dicarboxylate ABC transporter substrate-binding protein [Treponema sp.]
MKRIRFLTAAIVVAMALPAAVSAEGQGEKAASAGKITVTFAGTEAATTTQSRMMQAVADALNADGRFDAQVLVAGALSNDTNALVTQAKLGVPLVVPSDPGRLASQFNIPDLNILMAPYVLTDPAVLKNLPDTELFKTWSKQLETQGIVLIADMYNGFRNFYTTTPVKTVKDLSGLRIRGFGNDIGNGLARYFGFANFAIAFGEVFPAIQQKTLDGTEVQVSAAAGNAFWDVTKYVAMTKHYMLQTAFVCSTRLLSGMPSDARAFFLATIREKALEFGAKAQADEAGLYDQFRAKGVTITDVDIKEFQAAIAPLYTNNDLKFSPGLKDSLFKQLGL